MGGVSSTIGVVTSISMKSSIIDAPRESGVTPGETSG